MESDAGSEWSVVRNMSASAGVACVAWRIDMVSRRGGRAGVGKRGSGSDGSRLATVAVTVHGEHTRSGV